jgi:hypothetical protein
LSGNSFTIPRGKDRPGVNASVMLSCGFRSENRFSPISVSVVPSAQIAEALFK